MIFFVVFIMDNHRYRVFRTPSQINYPYITYNTHIFNQYHGGFKSILSNVCDTYIYKESIGVSEASERDWKTIQLPGALLKRVDELVALRNLGYSSRAELVKEAVRRRVEELEKFLLSKINLKGLLSNKS